MGINMRTSRQRSGVRWSSSAFESRVAFYGIFGIRRLDDVCTFLLGMKSISSTKAPEGWSTPGRCRDFA